MKAVGYAFLLIVAIVAGAVIAGGVMGAISGDHPGSSPVQKGPSITVIYSTPTPIP